MNRYSRYFLIVILACFFLLTFVESVVADSSEIIVEFYYAEDCDHCEEKAPVIDEIENLYGDNITVYRFSTGVYDYRQKFLNYGFKTTPGVVVINESKGNYSLFPYELITTENLKNAIDYHLAGNYSEKPPEPNRNEICLDTPFGKICLNPTELSLPVFTIILGALDSINPCSFFVLLILLSLLLHTKSRKRMLLVGGIFIFFSGFIYFLLMVAILFFFFAIEQQIIILLIAGSVALIFGGLNIKEFFFFKKGPSASIPEDKKSKLYKQMSKIVKMKAVLPVIIATIILAISANTVELLCSFNLPLVYTGILTSYNLDAMSYYLYLVFYNIIYVIPLMIIVGIIVFTLGRWKLSEWQGRILKLFSGTMMFSLGVILWLKPGLLQNIFTAISILFVSLFVTGLISIIWKKKYYKTEI